jgi:3-phenylpropionate/trans-cinnamate dioxygenase ferredoxin reductase subunit
MMDTEAYRYVIVGGGLAAASAAEGIREVDPTGSVVIVGQETRPPYHRPPVSKGILLGSKKPEDTYCKPEAFYKDQNIVLLTGVSARGLDADGRRVALSDGRTLSYDSLLLATGSRARRLGLPGADLEGIHTLRTLDDALTLVAAMKRANNAVVIGGSYIGAESASAFAQNGIQTTMVFPESRLLESLTDEDFARHLHSLYDRNRVSILTRQKPTRFKGQEHVTSVITDQKEEIPADLVIMGVGAELNTDLARQAGLDMNQEGGIRVDALLRASRERIFAAGDIADYPDPTYRKRLRLEHWETALAQGRTAGKNMAGAQEPFDALPHYFSTLFECGFSVWGDFSQWDQSLLKGEMGRSGSSIFYLEKGQLCGLLQFEPVEKEEAEVIDRLVRKRPSLVEVEVLVRHTAESLRESQ